MDTADFDYDLPPELIAQRPLAERSASRMMVVDRRNGQIEHRRFTDFPGYAEPGDVLVLNDTRVIPARLLGQREETGGRVELLLLEELPAGNGGDAESAPLWTAMVRASRPARVGHRLRLAGGRVSARIAQVQSGGRVAVELHSDGPLPDVLAEAGLAPVPPYIRRTGEEDELARLDAERYQTVYAREPGAVAAPTAGLHFTPGILQQLADSGVGVAHVTLHVGPGTFRPVKADRVEEHEMESERYELGPSCAAAVNAARAAGGRTLAVGSTSVRTLETVAAERGRVEPARGRSSLFIHPPYEFSVVDRMLTNFHLPRSTLLMMVSALATRELILEAYRVAVAERYRFYSYGDCMLIV